MENLSSKLVTIIYKDYMRSFNYDATYDNLRSLINHHYYYGELSYTEVNALRALISDLYDIFMRFNEKS